ncbi:uncharacterized protein LOC115770311 [Drosophila novamexicana]|uniref:uncharacterized protein LOC115770311 n=1 Tax=Drosophila novamexicana TaxID=47314 RepID=UPI0011E5A99F|nr:uncharacterized protein LOC115770311 [Drosophila novamexicana]
MASQGGKQLVGQGVPRGRGGAHWDKSQTDNGLAALCWRPFTVALKNFSCVALVPAITNEFSCIFNRKRNDPSMSVRFKLNEAVKQFSVLVDFDILKRDNTKMSVAHIKLDGCQYLRSAFKNNFYGKIFTRLQKLGNLPKNCPVQANKLFEIRN